ncbi:MAG: hypothetical protein ABIN80_28565 [Dyadobacter sp.]|uniref:hypothetical protein n=1 Tax=Dyadobacter sp. TaxID=1914288 RepID=UPI0032630DAF
MIVIVKGGNAAAKRRYLWGIVKRESFILTTPGKLISVLRHVRNDTDFIVIEEFVDTPELRSFLVSQVVAVKSFFIVTNRKRPDLILMCNDRDFEFTSSVEIIINIDIDLFI